MSDEQKFRIMRMKEAMDRAGLSSGQVAIRMNVTGAAVRGWVTGRRNIGVDELLKFAEIVDHPINYFLSSNYKLPDDFTLRFKLQRLNELVEDMTGKIGNELGFRVASDEEAINYLRKTHNLSDEAVAQIRQIIEQQ